MRRASCEAYTQRTPQCYALKTDLTETRCRCDVLRIDWRRTSIALQPTNLTSTFRDSCKREISWLTRNACTLITLVTNVKACCFTALSLVAMSGSSALRRRDKD